MDERPTVEVRDLRRSETGAAVALLARGLRDNPLNVGVYGSDPERRQRSVERTFRTLFRVFDAQHPICALDGGTLVAVSGVAPAGTCQPTTLQRLRSLPSMIAIEPGPAARVWPDPDHRGPANATAGERSEKERAQRGE